MAKKQQRQTITWTNERRKLRDLIPWEHNPRVIKQKQAERLLDSFSKFGQVLPICIGPNGEIYDGHQRRSVIGAADDFGLDYEVDVRVASRELTERERQQLTVYLHRGATGDFDMDLLADTFELDDLLAWGFEEGELLGFDFSSNEVTTVNDDGDQSERQDELQRKWNVKSGQVWHIGKHTLTCGDGTGVLPASQTIIVDPEWNGGAWLDIAAYDSALVFFDNNHVSTVVNHYGAPRWLFSWDCGTTWYVPNKPLLQAKFCAWYGSGKYIQDGWRYGESSFKKGKHTNGRGSAYDYEPHVDGRILSDIFKRAIAAEHKETDNNHSKPLDWITALIANCTTGDVLDPFAGSGTSLIACEQLGRVCNAVEILPGMVAAILERCEVFGISPISCAD